MPIYIIRCSGGLVFINGQLSYALRVVGAGYMGFRRFKTKKGAAETKSVAPYSILLYMFIAYAML